MNSSNRQKLLGPSLRVFDINIEGISRAKSEFLSKICLQHDIDVILLQETHAGTVEDLCARGNVAGYRLVIAESHSKYGTAIYVRLSVSHVTVLDSVRDNDCFVTVIKVNNITIVNIYKPPNIKWQNSVMKTYSHPVIYCGDFNSHSSDWGYQHDDENGEKLKQWAAVHELKLIHDPKQKSTFFSGRWNQGYNPDLCFVSCNEEGMPIGISRRVLQGFPNSQHRPIIFEIGLQVPLIDSVKKPRWNFRKANWVAYSKELDNVIGLIPPVPEN